MSVYVWAFLLGVVSGLRAMTPPMVVSWAAARMGWLSLGGTWLSWLGASIAPYILSLLAIGEIVNDKLPKTPSRKAPPSFAIRVCSGALAGAALGVGFGAMAGGLVAGALGAVAGTLAGYEARTRLVKATGGRDLPVALIEDVIAVACGFWIAAQAS
jgi:uncharacterized membrane protein